MKYFRIRTRTGTDKITVVADNVPTIEKAYEIVVDKGAGSPRKFYIDEVNTKLFSKLSVREARKRLDDLRKADEDDN